MINRYRFIKSNQIAAPTLQQIATAKQITNFADMLTANESIAPYEFESDAEMDAYFRKATEMHTYCEKGKNGEPFNRAKIVVDGRNFVLRVYGVKGASVPTRDYTSAEIKTLSFGFCKSGGKRVSDVKANPATGELEDIPTFYVKLA